MKHAHFCNFLVLLAIFACSGCMHYSAGIGTSLKFSKIYVAPVRNDSFAPQAQALLTRQLRHKLSSYPGMSLASTQQGAAVLDVTLTDISYSAETIDETDSEKAKTFEIKLSAQCSLFGGSDDHVYFQDIPVSAGIECYAFKDFQAAKYQLMPQITEQLAEKIVQLVCHTW